MTELSFFFFLLAERPLFSPSLEFVWLLPASLSGVCVSRVVTGSRALWTYAGRYFSRRAMKNFLSDIPACPTSDSCY